MDCGYVFFLFVLLFAYTEVGLVGYQGVRATILLPSTIKNI